jgi:4'-phosphopantetheinyl transferase EntD
MDAQGFTSLQKRSQGFLSGIGGKDSLIPNAVLITASYDTTAFSPSLFDDLGIAFPDTLQRAVDKRKAEYLAGRAVARVAMTQLDRTPEPVTNLSNRAPRWPDGLAGSISHARGRCACLLSKDMSHTYGVDTEFIAEGRSLNAILAETLSANERATITKGILPAATNATLAFSAKEALFKALHPRVGRHFGFDAAELTGPPSETGLTLTLTGDLTDTLVGGQSFTLHYRLTGTHVLTWLAVPAT